MEKDDKSLLFKKIIQANLNNPSKTWKSGIRWQFLSFFDKSRFMAKKLPPAHLYPQESKP